MRAGRAALAGLMVLAAGCATPPAAQVDLSMQGAGTRAAAPACPVWVDQVTDARSEAQRRSWHGNHRIELDEVTDAVRTSLLGSGIAEAGAPDDRFDVAVVNAYVSTVAGIRTFNLVLRVTHDGGDQWVTRGTSGTIPWAQSEGSVNRTMALALGDATERVVVGLSARCNAAVEPVPRRRAPPPRA